MKDLCLHIGTHKTGTSSFQRSLQLNRPALMAQGIRPILARKRAADAPPQGRTANHAQFAHLLLRPSIKTGARLRGSVPALTDAQRQQRLDGLADRIADMPEQTVLISAEGLCFLRTPGEQARLRRFVERTGRRVTTLAVFRNQADWRASWADQLRKDKHNILAQIEAEPEDRRINGEWYFDVSAIRGFWSAFNLKELAYEAHPNIVDALYREIGAVPTDFATDIFQNRRSQPDADG